MPEAASVAAFEDILTERMERYSRTAILERALPDARDGLKPSQRRILYSMLESGNTPDQPYRKCAGIVGDTMGRYHPHGDRSIYDALVRMSQDWVALPLIDFSGNGGSRDDDPPAAFRYTEARLSAVAVDLLRDIAKDSVPMVPTFDEKRFEPEVLPGYFPAMLVCGAKGLAVGFATDIPPHNTSEVVAAALALTLDPDLSDEALLELLPAPDFPTGGVIVGGAPAARPLVLEGRGTISLRARCEIVRERGRTQLVVTEIPYRVVKSALVKQIDTIRAKGQIDGVLAVTDASDQEGLRILVDLRRDADAEAILAYLCQKTELQVTYSANMTAIAGQRPVQMGVRGFLQVYIDHLRAVIRKRTTHDLEHAEARLHILQGLMRAAHPDLVDQVIATIRASKNRADAQRNLIARFAFSPAQAEAILMLRLYQITNLEITTLEREAQRLQRDTASWRQILADPAALTRTLAAEMRGIGERYAAPRRTALEGPAVAAPRRVSEAALAPLEEVVVSVTAELYVKRTSLRSLQRSEGPTGVREGDAPWLTLPADSRQTLGLLFAAGTAAALPVRDLPEARWREPGLPLVNFAPIGDAGRLVYAGTVPVDGDGARLLLLSSGGLGRQADLAALLPRKRRTAPCLAASAGELVAAFAVVADTEVVLLSAAGQALRTRADAFPRQGATAAGVVALRLAPGDALVTACPLPPGADRLLLVGEGGALQKVALADLPAQGRGGKGVTGWVPAKGHPQRPALLYAGTDADAVTILTTNGSEVVRLGGLPLCRRDAVARRSMETTLLGCRVVALVPPGSG